MRIVCFGYHKWALRIYDDLLLNEEHHVLVFRSQKHVDLELLSDFNPEVVLFYGWSWHVPEEITNRFTCLMLHPAPLPLYRGGSPIQNQIIAGEHSSAVTIFVMNQEVDAGPIVAQTKLSLAGTLDEIFTRVSEHGICLTNQILNNGIHAINQDHSLATYARRRTPEESEITVEEIMTSSCDYLYNKIRMLADPYPNAFIRTHDGNELVIHAASIRRATDS